MTYYVFLYFRFLWPFIMNVGWRERNQQDATNPMFIIELLSQYVSGIIMSIIRRTRLYTTAYGVLHCNKRGGGIPIKHHGVHIYTRNPNYICNSLLHTKTLWLTTYGFIPLLLKCRTPYAVVHCLVLLMMGIMMPETCWDRSLIMNIGLVASYWFLSLHLTYYIFLSY